MKVEDAHIAFVTELTVFNRGGNPSTAFKSDGTVVGLTPDKTVQETEAKLRAEWEASSSTLKQHYKTFENWRKAKSVK